MISEEPELCMEVCHGYGGLGGGGGRGGGWYACRTSGDTGVFPHSVVMETPQRGMPGEVHGAPLTLLLPLHTRSNILVTA